MKRILTAFIWVAAALLLPPPTALAQGTIVYYQPGAPLFGLVGQQLDLDGNGQTDITFYNASYIQASYYATGASGVGFSQLLVITNSGLDGGSDLVALEAGFLIGGNTGDLVWAGPETPNSYGNAIMLGSYFPEDTSGVLIPVGDFYDRTAFTGIRFRIGSEWHYGWVRIRGGVAGPSDDVFYLNPPGWILDWAYETRPQTAIRAGAKPVAALQASPETIRPGYLRLKWQTTPEQAYQVQRKVDFATSRWTNLEFIVLAKSINTEVDVPITGTAAFYRIVAAD